MAEEIGPTIAMRGEGGRGGVQTRPVHTKEVKTHNYVDEATGIIFFQPPDNACHIRTHV